MAVIVKASSSGAEVFVEEECGSEGTAEGEEFE